MKMNIIYKFINSTVQLYTLKQAPTYAYATIFPYPNDLVPTLDWVFKNQPMVSGILIHSCSGKQFASRRKRSLEKGRRYGSVTNAILKLIVIPHCN